MQLGLQDRVVLLTGGSSGIGRAAAVAFGAEGARVAITYRRDEPAARKAAAAVEEAGGRPLVLPMDLADPESVRAAVDGVLDAWRSLDVLVNNAVEWPAPPVGPPDFATQPAAEWQRTLRVLLDGTMAVTQAALPALRQSGSGRIVLLSSGTVEFGMPGEEAYAAAKAGLHGFMRSLARGAGRDGVLVNVVMPGLTLTERCERFVPAAVRDGVAAQAPSGRLSTPQDVAAAIVFLASAANGNITGEVVRVSGGL